jgi:hypothetical protein
MSDLNGRLSVSPEEINASAIKACTTDPNPPNTRFVRIGDDLILPAANGLAGGMIIGAAVSTVMGAGPGGGAIVGAGIGMAAGGVYGVVDAIIDVGIQGHTGPRTILPPKVDEDCVKRIKAAFPAP